MAELSLGNLPPSAVDFLPQYKAIGQSLKKRFFRKPNVAEAIEQYESLALELKREDQRRFAAICYLEAARCQESLKSNVAQGNSLIKAGGLLLQSWREENIFTTPESEKNEASHLFGNLELGIQTLNQAAKSFNSQGYKGSAYVLNLQLGDILYKKGSYGEALHYYKTALSDARTNFSFLDQLDLIERMVKCKVKVTDYESALKTVNDAMIAIKNYQAERDSPCRVVAKVALRMEMTKVMLTLIIGGNTDLMDYICLKFGNPKEGGEDDEFMAGSPVPQDSGGGDEIYDKEELRVKCWLKSLVLVVQDRSVKDFHEVRNRLLSHMTPIHCDLMRVLEQMHF